MFYDIKKSSNKLLKSNSSFEDLFTYTYLTPTPCASELINPININTPSTNPQTIGIYIKKVPPNAMKISDRNVINS